MTPEQIKHSVQVETRGWESRRAIPSEAATVRRVWAEQFPNMAPLHNAVADEWDRIAEDPECRPAVIRVIRRHLDDAVGFMANHQPDSKFYSIFEANVIKYDAMLMALDPNHER